MKYENPTNVVLDVKSFGENKTFKVSDKADVDFITNLLKNSKYIDEPCDGIIDYAITYDNDTYNILISCSEINRSGKQATISDEDMKKLEKILANAAEKNSGYKTLKIIDGAENGNLIPGQSVDPVLAGKKAEEGDRRFAAGDGNLELPALRNGLVAGFGDDVCRAFSHGVGVFMDMEGKVD